VVDKDDEPYDRMNILVQERIEIVAVIVALSFGAFIILTLLENKQWDNSVSWWVLSIAYWVVLVGILFTSLPWRTSISEIERSNENLCVDGSGTAALLQVRKARVVVVVA
jgi:predicted ferric reductase